MSRAPHAFGLHLVTTWPKSRRLMPHLRPSSSSPVRLCYREFSLSPKPATTLATCSGIVRAATLLIALFTVHLASAQTFLGYTLKAGPTLATQRWDGFEQSPLIAYHADLQVERLDYSSPTSLFASLGYHQRGSAIRSRGFQYRDPATGQEVTIRPQSLRFVFSNLGLTLGGKQHYAVGDRRGFVSLGLRGEYNLATDFGDTDGVNDDFGYGLAYPDDVYVRDFVYGVDVGVGLELQLSAKLDALLELRISPDVSQQYDQPPLQFFSPVTGNNESSGQRRINNVSIELSVGLRLLPEAAYE